MWLQVSLRNYRSIESAEVQLAPFAVLVGPNGSGKSNFVDALVLASELGFDASAAVQRRGGFGAIRRWGLADGEALQVRVRRSASEEGLPSAYAEQSLSLVPDNGSRWKFLEEHFRVVEPGREPLHFVRGEGHFAGRNGSAQSTPALPPTTSLMLYARQMVPAEVLAVRRLDLDLARMSAPQPPGESGKLLEDGSNIASVLGQLRSQDEQGFAFALAAMQRLVPGLEDVSVEEVGGFLVLRFSQRQPKGLAHFTASNMSQGALRALGIIVAAQTIGRTGRDSSPELLIVEEPEVAIHPGAAGLLFDVLKRASQQGSVLVTTHSPDLLDAAQDEEILVCSYRQGITRVGPLAKAQREVVREGLFSLSELARSEPLRMEGEEPEYLDPRDLLAPVLESSTAQHRDATP